MRIISFFIRSILFLSIAGAIVYFLGGQVWMQIALRRFEKDVEILQDVTSNREAHIKRCQTAPSSSDYSLPKAIQLRFINSQEYVVELLCTLIESTPVQLGQGKLPPFITKEPGSSGIYVDVENPGKYSFSVRSLRAVRSYVFDTKLQIVRSSVAKRTSSLPATTCAGWGYQCCSADGQKGSGVSQSIGVLDCSSRCFSICQAAPYVQGFVSDPYPIENGEVLMSVDSLDVTFSYTAGIAAGKIEKVVLDFGDGQSETGSEASGVFTHTYRCSGQCRFKAVIRVFDANGNSSIENSLSTLYIVRR